VALEEAEQQNGKIKIKTKTAPTSGGFLFDSRSCGLALASEACRRTSHQFSSRIGLTPICTGVPGVNVVTSPVRSTYRLYTELGVKLEVVQWPPLQLFDVSHTACCWTPPVFV